VAVGKGKLFWFFSVGLSVGKNQMCLTVRWLFFQLAGNGFVYDMLRGLARNLANKN